MTNVIDEIIQCYRETDAMIIAPRYAGRRGSPVLFDRGYFEELARLQGDQGGRELLAKYQAQVQFVDFDDARLALDMAHWKITKTSASEVMWACQTGVVCPPEELHIVIIGGQSPAALVE